MSTDSLSLPFPRTLVEAIAERAAEIVLEQRADDRDVSSPWLSIAEAADYARCDRQRIYDLRSSGRLSPYSDGSRAVVSRVELDAHLRSSRGGPTMGGHRKRAGTADTAPPRHQEVSPDAV
jgi:excisionase family DNA binding protein